MRAPLLGNQGGVHYSMVGAMGLIYRSKGGTGPFLFDQTLPVSIKRCAKILTTDGFPDHYTIYLFLKPAGTGKTLAVRALKNTDYYCRQWD